MEAGKPEVRLPAEGRRGNSCKYLLQGNPEAGDGQKEGPLEFLRFLGHSVNNGTVFNLLHDVGVVYAPIRKILAWSPPKGPCVWVPSLEVTQK